MLSKLCSERPFGRLPPGHLPLLFALLGRGLRGEVSVTNQISPEAPLEQLLHQHQHKGREIRSSADVGQR